MMKPMIWLFLVILLQYVLTQELKIGGIFYKDSPIKPEYLKEALEVSAGIKNFATSIKEVSRRGQILEVSQCVCELAQEGVIGIIDGTGGRASENIQALCDILEIPHVVIQHNDLQSSNWSLVNLHPSPEAYNMVLEELIIHKEWRNFTILYARGHSLLRVSELLHMGNETDQYVVTVKELSGKDYRDVLIDAKNNGYINFVVDCPSHHLEQLLLHAQQVGLMADEHSYIIVSPDLFSLDLNRYRYSGVNMTGLRLVDLTNTENVKLWTFTSELGAAISQELLAENLKTNVLLVHDAVEVFTAATKKVNVTPAELSCENYDAWIYGTSLLNFMKTNKAEGITRTLIFDGVGQRAEVMFDILELNSAGNETAWSWKDNKLKITRPTVTNAEITDESILRNKTLKVLISLTEPFGFVKESHEKLTGNDRYEGFAIDLIKMLSEILGFDYEFEMEKDYGSIKNGQWSGMVKRLREEEADLAITDFTITAERQTGIDFSTPFMTLGIGILYRAPSKQPPEMFSFMAVFSKEVWYNMLLIQLALGVMMIFVGRISHKEWQNPVPCIEQPEELSNQFSFANSVWLIIGSVMQQGSEIAPIALGPRMITSVWWFFTMVMVASYVGTLVAFLTVENDVFPFTNVEELYKHPSISYGAKSVGSTISFFKSSNNSMFKAMYKKMSEDKYGLVSDNKVGVLLAENTTYAFFMESSAIEYVKERHCDLIQIGGLLDSKSYGIGIKKDSPYKRYIDDALLKLKENGDIAKLKNIWWKEKKGGGKCETKEDEGETALGMKNMLGAFVVLFAGCLIGLLISVLDMLWGVFKRSVKYSTSYKYELIEEMKFAIKFSGNVKPVKRPAKTEDGSAEELASAEGKDEICSLRTIRSGRSTDTRRTHHSHSSRHSSRSLSVAFAKRRDYS